MVELDLKELIQGKKESKDYATIRMGLISELECFEAIEATGAKLYKIKADIDKAIKDGVDPNSQEMRILVLSAEKIHKMQAIVVNDVCARFEVIHPEIIKPDEELLKYKQLYWDWYRVQYKKYYGVSAPEIKQ